MNGNGYQLPRTGMTSMENIVPTLKPGINTVAMINEDGAATDSQLQMYSGKKQSTGSAVDKAGFTNGDLYVLNVPTISDDNVFRTTIAKSTPVDATFKKIEWNTDVPSFAKGARENGFRFARIEDGQWDPKNPDVYYFVTTESNKDPVATKENPSEPGVARDGGGLWRLTFKDAQNPLLGAKLELLLNGGEAPFLSKPDNMTITQDGVIMIQEDPGNNAHVARVLAYRIKDGKLATVASFDPKYFTAAGSNYMTIDEESSGIIDATSLLRKGNDKNSYFFLNAQIHTYSGVTVVDSSVKGATTPSRPDLVRTSAGKKSIIDNATVEGGQFYVMTVTDWNEVFKG
jgi:secreted PhoX family phosphatase